MKRKFLDENGRLFGLVSIIDVFAVAVIAVLAVAYAAKQGAPAIITAAAPMSDITYEVYIENMPDGRLEALRVGDSLYDGDTKSPMGTIREIRVEDCVLSIQKADGAYVMTEIPERSNVRLVIAAQARLNEGQIYVNRVSPISVGWSMNLYTKASRFSGAVLKIDQ